MKYILFTFIVFISINSFAGNYPAKKTIQKPVIDGNSADNCWNTASWAPIDQLWTGTAASSNNYSGRFKVAWDDSLVYILVEITDDIFHDTHPFPLVNYWDDDCIEIFVDEDKSGGNHEFSYNAFAYHVSALGHVVDYDTKGPALFDKNLRFDVDTSGHVYTWEVAMKIYNDKFNPIDLNSNRVNLYAGKVMGFSMAYNDSDSQNVRERMNGSQVINAADKNISYKTADVFGTLTLESIPTGVEDSNTGIGNTYFDSEKCELVFNPKQTTQELSVFSLEGIEIYSTSQLNSSTNLSLKGFKSGMYIVKMAGLERSVSSLKILIK